MISTPPHPFLQRLAARLLAKAERSTGTGPVRLKLDHREAPELYGQTDAEQLQRLVMLLEDMCAAGLVSLLLAPQREFAGFVDRKPQLELLDFDALAAWADYTPQSMRWQRQWLDYLATRWLQPESARSPDLQALLDYLARNPLLALRDLPMEDAARSLEALQRLCASGLELPLREASARVFQGRSKVLDNREELLRLLGAAPGQFREAPIQLLLDMPTTFDEALFIENLVTFERMADQRHPAWRRSLLIYAAGFKGSARRLRSRQGCRLYVRASPWSDKSPRNDGLQEVEAWLFGAADLRVRFFGDLDYAGMQILASLREVFADAQAWKLGYRMLADAIERGGGHPPQVAAKALQTDPGRTGCAYADLQLLPLMRSHGRFIDQELFSPSASQEGILRASAK
ncbi:hypothetical protein RA280_31095 [Cupriavidus sp. CV2]|uniref:hypothetical protein n=1 Tax=Cupriavidus ulmosensis TaxID=3065913 RepID=UPI00296AAD74|nr:hypothetical protein [Cupriavidus sp. CV2]MDW3686108.1 hypothetical protein [Cupriavidus sp. CV2]